jgi:hypothetical protein
MNAALRTLRPNCQLSTKPGQPHLGQIEICTLPSHKASETPFYISNRRVNVCGVATRTRPKRASSSILLT